MTTQKHLLNDETLQQAQSDVNPISLVEHGGGSGGVTDDFELPAKACDLGRPEGCESCQ